MPRNEEDLNDSSFRYSPALKVWLSNTDKEEAKRLLEIWPDLIIKPIKGKKDLVAIYKEEEDDSKV